MFGFMSSSTGLGMSQVLGLLHGLLSGVVLGLELWILVDITLDQSMGFSSIPMSCRLCPIR